MVAVRRDRRARRLPRPLAPTDGNGAVLEAFLSGRPTHDPVGWPTFKDWPAPDSLTHEGTYYKWMERAWQGGLRVFVNLLVENNQLCRVYPFKSQKVLTKNPTCDDMTTLRWEAQDMRKMERYIDAQYGGPGKGWYRIVTNPFEARKVINEGKLAVVMGIETSVPFGCSINADPADPSKDAPECSADADRPAARRGPQLGRAADGAGQQVRQRAGRRRR